jgi:hypothetical protein
MDTRLSPHIAAVRSRAPANHKSFVVTPEQQEFLRRHSLTIFTELANSGKPFADCLSGVFLTGLNYANELGNDER